MTAAAAKVDVAGEEARRTELAEEIHAVAERLKQLEDGRRFEESSDERRDRETRITYKRAELQRLQKEFSGLVAAADARAEAKREAAESARLAARPGLLERRTELEHAQIAALAGVEVSLFALKAAIEEALAPIPELQRIGEELGERRGYNWSPEIAARVKVVLTDIGGGPLRNPDPLIGAVAGRRPLAEPAAAATALPPAGQAKAASGTAGRAGNQGSAGRGRKTAAPSSGNRAPARRRR